ncbi:MAG: 30S ribosomal protein S2 [Patescibacteria group bacterium]|nr:30S ribosomal protein S2 [Patescibacteria group bacterium]MDD4611089.1 30S ribosomal protein S2 [Patescibacteria group bacterium]
MTKIPTLEEMLKAGMHFGHRTSRWHPKMKPYIYGERNGVHIIDLAKTQKLLAEALEFITKMISEGKVVLFVGTKPQVKETMKKMAEETGMPFIVGKWLGGCLTNFNIIKKSIRRYLDLTKRKEIGELKKYTKKEQLDFDREIAKLELRVGGLVNLLKIPDVVFVWDIKHEATAVAEAKKKNIPVVAVCDTNVNPDNVNYIIPTNDDATKTIKLIINTLKEAVEEGKAAKK